MGLAVQIKIAGEDVALCQKVGQCCLFRWHLFYLVFILVFSAYRPLC